VNHRPTKKTGPELEFVFKILDDPTAPVGVAKKAAAKAGGGGGKKGGSASSASAPTRPQNETLEALSERLARLVLDKSSLDDTAKDAVLRQVIGSIETELVALRNESYAAGFMSARPQPR